MISLLKLAIEEHVSSSRQHLLQLILILQATYCIPHHGPSGDQLEGLVE